jgi:hypothetical protein
MALYQEAKCNLFVSNGPAGFQNIFKSPIAFQNDLEYTCSIEMEGMDMDTSPERIASFARAVVEEILALAVIALAVLSIVGWAVVIMDSLQ